MQGNGQKAFVAYLTAGDPSLSATVELVLSLERAGADIIELGVPFSDPLADGAVNQLAAQRALDGGATLAGLLQTVAEIRQRSQVPLVLFTYLNPIFRFGLQKFVQQAAAAGVDGLLLLDLPPEETLIPREIVEQSMCRICLVAPTTPDERLAGLVGSASGFVYYVSRAGVTGMQTSLAHDLSSQVKWLRSAHSLPVCVGFGISDPEQARTVAELADGVVVGSALVSRIAEWGAHPDLPHKLESFARPFATAIHAVRAVQG